MDVADADRLAERLADDWRSAELDARDEALLEYAERLTNQPWSVTEQHVQVLRDSGLDDRGIHDLCAIVAYFAFANRIANGLGIELEQGP